MSENLQEAIYKDFLPLILGTDMSENLQEAIYMALCLFITKLENKPKKSMLQYTVFHSLKSPFSHSTNGGYIALSIQYMVHLTNFSHK